jgi:hypothetical protein
MILITGSQAKFLSTTVPKGDSFHDRPVLDSRIRSARIVSMGSCPSLIQQRNTRRSATFHLRLMAHLNRRLAGERLLYLGQTLVHHPHLHFIFPGGGLSPDGTPWIARRLCFFLPVRMPSLPLVCS